MSTDTPYSSPDSAVTDPAEEPQPIFGPAVLVDGQPHEFASFGIRYWARMVDMPLDFGLPMFLFSLLPATQFGVLLELAVTLLGSRLIAFAFEASPMRATPGKWLFGLRICSRDGSPASVLRIAVRHLFRGTHLLAYLLALPLLVDYRSGWDWISGLRVIHKRPSPQAPH